MRGNLSAQLGELLAELILGQVLKAVLLTSLQFCKKLLLQRLVGRGVGGILDRRLLGGYDVQDEVELELRDRRVIATLFLFRSLKIRNYLSS